MTPGTPARFPTPPHTRHRGGFSLIEILVTVSIIALLIGITVAVGAKMKDSGKSSATRTLLASVMTLDTEYEVQTGQHVDHASTTLVPGPLSAQNVKDRSIERLVAAAKQYSSSRAAFERLPRDSVVDLDGNGFIDIVDSWGTKLIYVRQSSTGDPNTAFLPENRTPFAASAGPDRTWGDAYAAVGSPDHTAAQDNIYSFNLD